MILKLHYPFEEGTFWSDEGIMSLVGQETEVSGCPAKIIDAHRCVNDENAMDLQLEIDNGFKSYIRAMTLYNGDKLLDSISIKE